MLGTHHFLELLNGAIAVYDKTGTLLAHTNMDGFFSHTEDGTNYPLGGMVDPRVLFDHAAQRWVACAWDTAPNSKQAILAVSNGTNPTNLLTGWTRHLIRVRREGQSTDFTTLGLDANGIYLTVVHFTQSGSPATNVGQTVVAIKKPEIYQGTNLPTRLEITNGVPVWTVQPAINFDAAPTNGYAWFVAKGPPDLGTNYQGGALLYRRLQWSGTNAAWVDTDWATNAAVVAYRDYYDLDGTNTATLPDASAGVIAPQAVAEGGVDLYLQRVGSRLAMTVIRNGALWTCQAIGLSGTNGAYSGSSSGISVDRSGVQWLKFKVDAVNGTLSYSLHGRVYDPAPTTPHYYYYPSLMVNCAGDMVIGFSGSSVTDYISTFYTWRTVDGSTPTQPSLLRAGTTFYYGTSAWGDYTATTLDPTDDWSFWTVQQHASRFGASEYWETVIGQIRANP